MFGKLLNLFGTKNSNSLSDEEQRMAEAEMLEVEDAELEEAYDQGYQDALDGRDFEDSSEEYAAGYQDAVDDIERSEESW